MGDVIRKKMFIYDVVSILLALLLFIFLFGVSYYNINYQGDERVARVELNRLLVALENESDGILNVPDSVKDVDYPYCVFDKSGQACASTILLYTAGEKYDLATIGTNRYYMVPIIHESNTEGILIADLSGERVSRLKSFLMPEIIVSLILIAALCFVRYKAHNVIKKDIWEPVNEIHKSTRKILNGSFEENVNYDYSGEIGTLCHDFERMRDELKDSAIRQQQSQEKERALYASISHDLKTPLAIITGYLEQIVYGVSDTKEQILTTAGHALTKVNVLTKLTEDILEHSKAQMNQLRIEKSEVYANEYFEELFDEYRREADLQDYEFTSDPVPDVLIEIDPVRIAQVVQNIISNSVKYRKEDLKVYVSFEIIKQNDRYLVISIQDNGKGIEAADLPFIFDAFYRGNKARTQSVPGSGIGLNISKYIVEQHGGTIECDSVAGVGTTMTFSIPVI